MDHADRAPDETRPAKTRPVKTRTGPRTRLTAAALALALAACAGPDREDDRAREREDSASARPAAAPLPWPGGFEGKAVLMAVRVVITGPEGLREHAAVLQDPGQHAYEEKTTTQGFIRRTTLEPGIDYLAPIRGRLDGLQIFAEQELLVIERPGPVGLTVEASGDVLWRDTQSGEERRGEQLVLSGSGARAAGAGN
jgi:hypothetical protein